MTKVTIKDQSQIRLLAYAEQIKARRKALKVSSTALAEITGISRMTLHRIEQGEASVNVGAYDKVLNALNLQFLISDKHADQTHENSEYISVKIYFSEYPQLRELSWHIQGLDYLRPLDAYRIYKRNQRHLDKATMLGSEKLLIKSLHEAFEEAEI